MSSPVGGQVSNPFQSRRILRFSGQVKDLVGREVVGELGSFDGGGI